MPHFDIVRKASPAETFRVANVIGTYDLQAGEIEERFTGDIEVPEHWNVGLIVGRSGTGKTTIARELFGAQMIDGYEWTHECLLDDFPKEAQMNDIYQALNSVGFSSPPSWLKPFAVLSNGEKMRCEMARAIVENKEMFVFDEFTSVVDRDVAKIGSLATQKAIRRAGKKFIAVTCHHDVQDWLMPDWVFNTDTMTFQVFDLEAQKKNRPRLELRFYRVEGKQKEFYWRIFRKYHYLTHNFHKAAHLILCECNGVLCGFAASMPLPQGFHPNLWKAHRIVVLPDHQGVGIGNALTTYVAEDFRKRGKDYTITTSNPSMIMALKKSPLWICKQFGRKKYRRQVSEFQKKFDKSASTQRITAQFMYVGDKSSNKREEK